MVFKLSWRRKGFASLRMAVRRKRSMHEPCGIERLESRLQMAGASSGFVPPVMPVTTTNTTQVVKVLVVNFDPLVPSEGNKRLWEVFPNWTNPRTLAAAYKAEMEYASGGAITFEIVTWRDVNDIPVLANGYDYTPDEYVRNTRSGTGWQPANVLADFAKMAASQDFATPVNAGLVDEVWLFGEHHFGLFGETWMVGPDAFYVNGPIFTDPALRRPFVGNGFDYGRGVGEMMHNTAHRLESTMARFFGGRNATSSAPPADLPGSSTVGRLSSYQFAGSHEANVAEATAMLGWLGATITSSDPNGGWVTGSLSPDLIVTIWPKTYGKSTTYGVRFGSVQTGTTNESYFEVSTATTNWDRFAAVVPPAGDGVGGVGNCHFPVNGESDYDYGNPRLVRSTANDWLAFPQLTGTTSIVSRDSWSSAAGGSQNTDYHKDYLSWMYGHLPRASGITVDGRQANWWKYLYDYSNYQANTGAAKGFSSIGSASDVRTSGGSSLTFTVAYASAYGVRVSTIGTGDVVVRGPNGYSQPAAFIGVSDYRDNGYLVATYRVEAPGRVWDAADNGAYSINLQIGAVWDRAGRAEAMPGPEKAIAAFRVDTPITRPSAPINLVATAGASSAILTWNKPLNGAVLGTKYQIAISTDGRRWINYSGSPSTALSRVVPRLAVGVGYYFRVRAVNAAGAGDWSNVSSRVVPLRGPVLFGLGSGISSAQRSQTR